MMAWGVTFEEEVVRDVKEVTQAMESGDAERVARAAHMLTGAAGVMSRVMSPSAEVQGHSPSQRVTVPNKRNVKIKELRPVGNYAVRIVFDDGHDTGLFSWTYLAELGRDKATSKPFTCSAP